MHTRARRLTIACALIASATLSLGLAGTAMAANIVVDTAADAPDTPVPGTCSLREAVESANDDAATGGCTAGSGGDVITFDPAAFPIGAPAEQIDLAAPGGVGTPIVISGPLEIQGPGRDELDVLNSDAISRILDVAATGPVTISGLEIREGDLDGAQFQGGAGIRAASALTLTDVAVTSNEIVSVDNAPTLGATAVAQGAGIWSVDGPLTIDSSVIEGNTVSAVSDGTDVDAVVAQGAGMYHDGLGFPLTVTNSFIQNNDASASDDDAVTPADLTEAVGGGIYAQSDVTIEQTTFDDNSVTADSDLGTAQAKGGAIRLDGDSSRIELSTLTANRAVAGAGDQLRGAGVLVIDNTMDPNTVEVTSSTIAENGALAVDTDGANLYAEGPGGALVSNTIITAPVGSTPATTSNCDEDDPDPPNEIVSSGFNVDHEPGATSSSCHFTATGDLTVDPQLLALTENGGIGPTMLPDVGSPVIDQGSSASQTVADEDQRELDRPAFFSNISNAPLGDGADIGAVEVQIAPPTFTGTTPASPSVDDTPNVLGAVSPADSVDPLIVRLFTDPSCAVPSGTPADPSVFASPGIVASPPVPHNNVTTTFHGTVETDYGVSHCSTGAFPNTIGYQNTLIDPTPPVVTPPPVTTTPAPAKKKCKKGFVRKKGKCVKKKRKKKR